MAQALDPVEIHYKLNRILLTSIGLWPYQRPWESRLAKIISSILMISQTIVICSGLARVINNMDMVIECLPPIGIIGLCLVKLINLTKNSDKMEDLLRVIQEDWRNTVSTPEIEIVKRSAEQSLKLSKIYTVILCAFGTLFVLQPILEDSFTPSVINTDTNKTEFSKRLPYIAEYYVDTEKYYYPIILHSYLASMTYLTISLAADTMFVLYLYHGCTKFRIFKYRLSQVIQVGTFDFDSHPDEIDDVVFEKIKICVHFHNEAIRFANAIESTYATCQLFQVVGCCFLMSITGLHASTKLSKPDELVKYFGVIFSLMLHLAFYSWLSQELMDASLSVSEAIYSTEWYRVSVRSRKLLLQMMTRSIKPCKITAGRMSLMSMENYCKILSNSMSYFTVLSSMQEQSIPRQDD